MLIKDYRHPKQVDVTPAPARRFPQLMAQLIKGGFTHGPLIVETHRRRPAVATGRGAGQRGVTSGKREKRWQH